MQGDEDYKHLAMLARAGRGEEGRAIILPLAGSWYEWEKDAAQYELAREKLARLISGLNRQR